MAELPSEQLKTIECEYFVLICYTRARDYNMVLGEKNKK